MSEITNNAAEMNTTVTTTPATAVAAPEKPKRKLKPWIKWAAGGAAVLATGTIILVCLAKGKKPPTEVVNTAAQAAATVADAASTVA